MTLTPGYYRTRAGRKARVLCVDAGDDNSAVGYVVNGGGFILCSWNNKGAHTNLQQTGYDLIEPWTEPKPKKKITLRRALMQIIVAPMCRSESMTKEFYHAQWVSENHENELEFVRWLDEEPLVIEVDGE